LKPGQVGVEPPAPYLVAPRLGQVGDTETGEQRADDHDRATQSRTAPAVVFRTDVIEVYVAGPEGVAPLARLFYFHAHGTEHLHELDDVHDFRDVAERHAFGCQKRGTNYLEGLVLGPLGRYLAFQAIAAPYDEFSHTCGVSLHR